MKAAKIILVILVISALIGWVRGGHRQEHIARTLPFCGGHRPGLYDLGGVAMLGLLVWGLARLKNGSTTEETEDEAAVSETPRESAPEDEEEDPAEQPDEVTTEEQDEENSN